MMLKSLSNSEGPSNVFPAYINVREYYIIFDFSVLVALPHYPRRNRYLFVFHIRNHNKNFRFNMVLHSFQYFSSIT